jgi:putative MATE family efflux protein
VNETEKPGRDERITNGPVFKTLIILALPIIVGNLLQSVLEIVDLHFIGGLGNETKAGVSMSGYIMMVLMTVIIGLVTACNAFIARAYGAKRYSEAGQIIWHAILIGIGFSIILALIGQLFAHDILAMMGATGGALESGTVFLQILTTFSFTMIVLFILQGMFQSTGDTITPMLILVLTNVVNIFLNPTLINGFEPLGIPGFGVAGSASATVIARSLGVIVLLWLLMRNTRNGKITALSLPKHKGIDLHLVRKIVAVAIPSSIQSGVRSVAFLIMMSLVATYGMIAVSAYGIVARLEMVALMPGFGIAAGVAIMIGQNLGARKIERAEKAVNCGLLLYGALMLCVAVIYALYCEPIVLFFDPSGAAVPVAERFFHTVTPTYLFLAMGIIFSFSMNGAGNTRPPMIGSLVAQLIVQVSLAAYVVFAGYPIEYVWYTVIVGNMLMFVLMFLFYRRGSWKKVKLLAE